MRTKSRKFTRAIGTALVFAIITPAAAAGLVQGVSAATVAVSQEAGATVDASTPDAAGTTNAAVVKSAEPAATGAPRTLSKLVRLEPKDDARAKTNGL